MVFQTADGGEQGGRPEGRARRPGHGPGVGVTGVPALHGVVLVMRVFPGVASPARVRCRQKRLFHIQPDHSLDLALEARRQAENAHDHDRPRAALFEFADGALDQGRIGHAEGEFDFVTLGERVHRLPHRLVPVEIRAVRQKHHAKVVRLERQPPVEFSRDPRGHGRMRCHFSFDPFGVLGEPVPETRAEGHHAVQLLAEVERHDGDALARLPGFSQGALGLLLLVPILRLDESPHQRPHRLEPESIRRQLGQPLPIRLHAAPGLGVLAP